jgi:hypothetical protein
MAEDNGNELFSDKIVSRYDLVDAILDGVLPVPVYKSAYINLLDYVTRLEDKVTKRYKGTPKLTEQLIALRDIKRKIISSIDVKELLLRNIKKNGKYIYFCPPISVENENDIHTIMDDMKKFLISRGYHETDFEFYFTTGDEEAIGKKNRNAFYHDVDLNGKDTSRKLRIMFAINQYNEGVHAPNVDGVILGRETSSDIVFFEQIGRALSVRGDTYVKFMEYQNLSFDEIKKLCEEKDISINDRMTKDDMIERLVAPVIIDLVGNYTFIRDLVTELKHRIKLYKGFTFNITRNIEITENSFDVEFKEHDLYEALFSLNNTFIPKSWDESYELASNFYNKFKNLDINRSFKSDDGMNFDQYGYALGEWIVAQRKMYNKGLLEVDKIKKLNKIGMIWSYRKSFDDVYEMAKNYYNKNGNLRVPYNYKTNDGLEFSLDGYSLGSWIIQQRRKKKSGNGKDCC